MRKINSTARALTEADARALTEAEMDAVAGGTRGFFNEIIAKGVAIEQAKKAGILGSEPLHHIESLGPVHIK